MTNFEKVNKVIAALEAASVPCRVKLVDRGEIVVECGRNYPDELVDRIYKAVGDIEVSIMAEIAGASVLHSDNVAGGPQRYSIWKERSIQNLFYQQLDRN